MYKEFLSAAAIVLTFGDVPSLHSLHRERQNEAARISWVVWALSTLGGALFADRRYGNVFVYHNGAPSYFAGRGFRGSLRV